MTTTAQESYRAGRLDDAIAALGAELRDRPDDARRRSFLFELLCFAGQYDRAEKQLDVLAGAGQEAFMGALLYRSALHAERTRQRMFETDTYPMGAPAPAAAGSLNGRRFTTIADADPRVGPRLELFAAGQYTWVPFAAVARLVAEPPRMLRDTLWIPARVTTAPSYNGVELGEVLLPALAPLSHLDEDGAVRLGQATAWVALADGREAPVGQKLLVVDGEEVPLLELRELEIDQAG